MTRHLEGCQQGLTARFEGKFLQIKFRRFPQVADSFRHGFTLGGGTCLGIVGSETTFLGGYQNSGQRHGINLPEYGMESSGAKSSYHKQAVDVTEEEFDVGGAFFEGG
jgi:hypothetical protein